MTPAVPHAADARAVEEGEAPAGDEAVGEAHAAATGDGAAGGLVSHQAADTHTAGHTQVDDDDHAHAEPRVGPIDWPAWGYAILGMVVALLVVGLFFLAIN